MTTINMEITAAAAAALWCAKRGHESPSETILRLLQSAANLPPKVPQAQRPSIALNASDGRYEVLGQRIAARTAKEAYLHIIGDLSDMEPSLMPRLAEMAKSGSRNHFSLHAENVYPGRIDLMDEVVPLGNGWFAGVNISNSEKSKFLRLACEILGLTFGKDVKFAPK